MEELPKEYQDVYESLLVYTKPSQKKECKNFINSVVEQNVDVNTLSNLVSRVFSVAENKIALKVLKEVISEPNGELAMFVSENNESKIRQYALVHGFIEPDLDR